MPDPAAETVPSDSPAIPDALRVQILATELWSLLATRSMTWNEIFTRASMFLTTLSAAVVSLALIAQATGFDESFRAFALVVLPVVLFLGISTLIRLGDAMTEDAILLLGMNSLRHAYLDLVPDLEPFFVTGHHDDLVAHVRAFGGPSRIRPSRMIAATPTIVGVIDAALVGVMVGLVAATLEAPMAIYTAAGVTAGLASGVLLCGVVPARSISHFRSTYHPRFPKEQ